MAGSKNNPTNRTIKQAPKTVLVITYGPGLKEHRRLVHSEAFYAEVDGRLAQGAGRR